MTPADTHAETVSRLVARRARESPAAPAVVFESDVLTYGELDRRATALATGLASRGVGRGDRVAVRLPNGREGVETWVALCRSGAIEVPLHPALRGASLADPIRRTAPVSIVTDAGGASDIRAAMAEHAPPGLVVVGDDAVLEPDVTYADLLARGGAVPDAPDVSVLDDVSVVLFSSGSTGPPKGVQLTHRANHALADAVVAAMAYGPDDVLFNAFPFSHVNARFTSVLAGMVAGCRVVLHERLSVSRFWDICAQEGVTAFNFMGVVPLLLLDRPESSDPVWSTVTRAYGSGAAGRVATDFERRFGVRLVETYGSTELGMVTVAPLDERREGSCGVAVPDYEVAVVDPEGWPVEAGAAGEIVVRPCRPGRIFRGYLADDAATVSSWRDLWFHTGDRGYLDADGWLFFVDRIKDSIRRRGENISSWQIERTVEALADVVEACAVGVPSDLDGEDVLLVVVADPGAVAPEDLIRECERHLPAFAVPRYVRYVDALPRTPSARVEKYRLRAAGVTPDTWERGARG